MNTGEVVAGDLERRQRLVTGDAVNVAARLEQAAAPGEFLLGESTYRLVKDAVEVKPVEPLDLKGKSEPVRAFRLDAVLADAAGHERHLDSPMVGRHKELEMLERALDRAGTERTSHLFTLLGPGRRGEVPARPGVPAGPAPGRPSCAADACPTAKASRSSRSPRSSSEAAGIGRTDDLATRAIQARDPRRGAEDGERIAALVAGLFGGASRAPTEDASGPSASSSSTSRASGRSSSCSTTSIGPSPPSST